MFVDFKITERPNIIKNKGDYVTINNSLVLPSFEEFVKTTFTKEENVK